MGGSKIIGIVKVWRTELVIETLNIMFKLVSPSQRKYLLHKDFISPYWISYSSISCFGVLDFFFAFVCTIPLCRHIFLFNVVIMVVGMRIFHIGLGIWIHSLYLVALFGAVVQTCWREYVILGEVLVHSLAPFPVCFFSCVHAVEDTLS